MKKTKWLLLATALFSLASFSCNKTNDDDDSSDVAITAISISSSVDTVAVGEAITLKASLTPSNATGTVEWISGNTDRATVQSAGTTCIVKGVAEGTVDIIAKNGNVSDSKTITVTTASSSNATTDVDYTNYSNSTYLVKVRNNTSKKLVAFKGSPSKTTLIGGVPASTTNHALPKSSELFSTSQDFVLFFVTEDDYNANKENLTSLENKPFARLYSYYNTNAANNIVYEISSVMGGDMSIVLQNNTSYNVELRKDGIYGETIGYTGASTINTTFKVDSGDYYVFPVFRKFDTTLNEIVTVYPKYTSGNAAGKDCVEYFSLNDSQNSVQLDASNWSSGVAFTSGYAYIRINNQSKTGINLYDGANSTPLVTSTGCSAINSSKSYVFTLKMDLNQSNSTTGQYEYEDFKTYSMLHIGNALKSDYYITGSDSETKDFYAGKIYTYTVKGNTIYDLTVELTNESEMSQF